MTIKTLNKANKEQPTESVRLDSEIVQHLNTDEKLEVAQIVSYIDQIETEKDVQEDSVDSSMP